jgi:hypothetical protein
MNTDVFLGDSGGPMMVYSDDNQQYELVGITSFRNQCLNEGIYTRIYPFTDWILDVLKNPPPTVPPFVFPTIPPVILPTPQPDVLGRLNILAIT